MRLIDADVLMPNAEYKGKYDTVNAYDIVNCPTIDAEPVVHCKDCKHYTLHCTWNGEKRYWCELDILQDGENGFCSQGKKTVFAQIITGLKEAIEYEKENGAKMEVVNDENKL